MSYAGNLRLGHFHAVFRRKGKKHLLQQYFCGAIPDSMNPILLT
jgi:hypothetical protein